MRDWTPSTRQRRGGLDFDALAQEVRDGRACAFRPLTRQAQGVNTLDLRGQQFEFKSLPDGTGGERLQFEGYFSTTEDPYTLTDWLGDYTEVVRAGAFKKTLSEAPDTIFVVNHDWNAMPMARTLPGTLEMSEDATGGLSRARIDPSRSDVAMLRSAMEGGELNAMSFAFYVTRQTWSPDYDQRDILEVDLNGGDNSVVTWPANPGTTGTTSLRSMQAKRALSSVPSLLLAHCRSELRAGKALSAATMDVLQQVLDLVAAADDAVDEAQPLLADLMGVANPDADDESGESDSANSGQQNSLPGPDPVAVRNRLRLKHAAA